MRDPNSLKIQSVKALVAPFWESVNTSHKGPQPPHSPGKRNSKPAVALLVSHMVWKRLQRAWSFWPFELGFLPSRFISIILTSLLLGLGSISPRVVPAKTPTPPLIGPSEEVLEELKFLQEETVSIAVLHEQPISEAPSNVYVITDDDIRHSGATDLPTVLRRIPGMEVIQMTALDFRIDYEKALGFANGMDSIRNRRACRQ